MKSFLLVLVIVGSVFILQVLASTPEITELDLDSLAKSSLEEYHLKDSQRAIKETQKEWNFRIMGIEPKNSSGNSEFDSKSFLAQMDAKLKTGWKNIPNADLKRQFEKLMPIVNSPTLTNEKLEKYKKLEKDMAEKYNTAKVCKYNDDQKCDLSLNPDVTQIMAESRDEAELKHIWKAWHDKTGNNEMKKLYEEFVTLANEDAQLKGFNDAGAYSLKNYESDTFKNDIETVWQTMKPFYQQIHAYVRAKLRITYPDQFTADGNLLIPAHLLGNIVAQTWENIYSLMIPFPEKVSIDVTEQMKKQDYKPLKMFNKSEEFFTSLGLIPMPQEFWDNSIIEKPQDLQMDCHPSAWDFSNGKDFRITMCTVVTMQDFLTVHHEMGHIQYILQYKDQPYLYRFGANPGFHEAIGDTLALSVQTPKHLKEIGLLEENAINNDHETTINFLFKMALDKFPLLSYSYLLETYRWSIFDGSVKAPEYNSKWWQMRKEYQGIKSPEEISKDNFDAAGVYHIPNNYDYINYFVAIIIQFQFHRALCIEAGQYDINDLLKPLHNCDIYNSKKAGSKLAAGLKMGASRPWPEVMKVITGQDKMDASAIVEYFKPLEDWLKEENEKSGATIGWKQSL